MSVTVIHDAKSRMHYGTFALLTGTPEAFERELKQRKLKTQLRVMKIGETTALL